MNSYNFQFKTNEGWDIITFSFNHFIGFKNYHCVQHNNSNTIAVWKIRHLNKPK